MFGRKKKDKRSNDRIVYGIGFDIELINLKCGELETKQDAYTVMSVEKLFESIVKDIKILNDRNISDKVLGAIDEKYQKVIHEFERVTK